MNRPSWDEYFIGIAKETAKRGSCLRRQVGCVLVYRNKIIGAGYNGAIAGDENCEDVGCLIVGGHCVRCLHAEVNAALNSICYDFQDGITAYITSEPCFSCFKVLRQAGVNRFVYLEDYVDETRDKYIAGCHGISWEKYEELLPS